MNDPTHNWHLKDPDLIEVKEKYNAWGDMVARRSFEATYALGASCWVLLTSKYGDWCDTEYLIRSLYTCFIFILFNVGMGFILKMMLNCIYRKAEKNFSWWNLEAIKDEHHPEGTDVYYTSLILHWGRAIIPVIASTFFLLGSLPALKEIQKAKAVAPPVQIQKEN